MKIYFTVKEIPLHYPAFTQSSIRWLIFNEKTNGFNNCIRRLGKKIIDKDKFEELIDQQTE